MAGRGNDFSKSFDAKISILKFLDRKITENQRFSDGITEVGAGVDVQYASLPHDRF